MLRPNLAQDAPPTALTIGGVDYAINVDFRAWIGVIHLLRDLISAPETIEQAMRNVETIDRIETIVFGYRIPQPASDVLNAVIDFSAGYPAPPVGEGNESAAQTQKRPLNNRLDAVRRSFPGGRDRLFLPQSFFDEAVYEASSFW